MHICYSNISSVVYVKMKKQLNVLTIVAQRLEPPLKLLFRLVFLWNDFISYYQYCIILRQPQLLVVVLISSEHITIVILATPRC